MKALIFAAGKGTRLKPFTDHHPKALAKVNRIPLLERNIQYLKSFGIRDFVINVHHFAAQIVSFLQENNNFGCRIQISDESGELLETGGGLLFAREYLDQNEDFIIMNADILTDLRIDDLIKYHKNHGDFVTLAVSDRESSRKLLFNENFLLKGWKNSVSGEMKLAADAASLQEFAFSGIHCVDPKIFSKIKRTGKFSIMDEYLDLMSQENIHGFLHQNILIDVGRPASIQEAELYFK